MDYTLSSLGCKRFLRVGVILNRVHLYDRAFNLYKVLTKTLRPMQWSQVFRREATSAAKRKGWSRESSRSIADSDKRSDTRSRQSSIASWRAGSRRFCVLDADFARPGEPVDVCVWNSAVRFGSGAVVRSGGN